MSPCLLTIMYGQGEASGHSLGFVDKNLGSSPGLIGQQVATVAAHQPGELHKSSSSKPPPLSVLAQAIPYRYGQL